MIAALLRLTRLYYSLALAAGFAVILCYLTGGRLADVAEQAAFAVSSLLFVVCGSYALNDVCDVDVDRINCPNRPLPAGEISRRAALLWAASLYAAGLAVSFFCGLRFLLALSLIAAISVFYDIFSKRIALWKDVLVAVLMSSVYPLAFGFPLIEQSTRLRVLHVHFVWLFFTCLSYEMLKDIRDVEGDVLAAGEQNRFRASKSFLACARILSAAASLLTILPFVLGCCGAVYLTSAIIAITLAFCSIFFRPIRAIMFIYAEIMAIVAGSFADLFI